MIGWVLQVTVMSLCFIAVVHYLYIFFKTTLTVPKVKDLVNRPQQQYEELFKGIDLRHSNQFNHSGSGSNNYSSNNYSSNNSTTSLSALPPLLDEHASMYNPSSHSSLQPSQQNAMKDELKQFLKKLNRP